MSTAWTFNRTMVTCLFTPLLAYAKHLCDFSLSRSQIHKKLWRAEMKRRRSLISANCHIAEEVIPILWKRGTSGASIKEMGSRVRTYNVSRAGSSFLSPLVLCPTDLCWCPPASVSVVLHKCCRQESDSRDHKHCKTPSLTLARS